MMQGQKGVGLIEVLVALMLLAVAVLGFSAMQIRAIKATDESLIRTRALTVLRGAAEMMRANADGIEAFKTAINGTSLKVSNSDTSNVEISKNSCTTGGTPATCTIKQLAVKDALTVKQYAKDNELQVAVVTCPGTGTTTTASGQARQCLIASWGKTDPILLEAAVITDTTKDKPCADNNAIYHSGAECFIMEAY